MRVVNDRRSSRRVAVRGEALVHTPQGPLRCRCRDISSRGMSLVSTVSVKPRQRVQVESSFRGQLIVFDAMVVRRNRSREGHILGMRFEGLGEQARRQLAELLDTMQVQAALAMQSCAVADRLPMLQIPDPHTERAPHVARVPSPAPAPSTPFATPWPRAVGPMPRTTQEVPAMVSSRPPVATPKGGTVEVPAMASAAPQVATPKGGTDEPPAMASAASAVEPPKGGTVEMPAMASAAPQVPTPKPAGAERSPTKASARPYAVMSKPDATVELPAMAPPRGPSRRPRGTVEMPAMVSTPSQQATPKPGGTLKMPHVPVRMGPEWGWTEDELVTSHYRPFSESSSPHEAASPPEPAKPSEPEPEPPPAKPEPPPAHDEPASLVDALELGLDTGEVGAPSVVAPAMSTQLPELELDEPAPLDRTMLSPRPPELAEFATTSPATSEDDPEDGWLGPARTGKTMVVYVQDLIAAYSPTLEPELDLPEPTGPITEPMAMPKLSDELQAALDRLRRRDDKSPLPPRTKTAPLAAKVPEKAKEDPAKGGRRNRRRSTTQVYAVSRREDMQVKALYHAARDLPEPDRGEGS